MNRFKKKGFLFLFLFLFSLFLIGGCETEDEGELQGVPPYKPRGASKPKPQVHK